MISQMCNPIPKECRLKIVGVARLKNHLVQKQLQSRIQQSLSQLCLWNLHRRLCTKFLYSSRLHQRLNCSSSSLLTRNYHLYMWWTQVVHYSTVLTNGGANLFKTLLLSGWNQIKLSKELFQNCRIAQKYPSLLCTFNHLEVSVALASKHLASLWGLKLLVYTSLALQEASVYAHLHQQYCPTLM